MAGKRSNFCSAMCDTAPIVAAFVLMLSGAEISKPQSAVSDANDLVKEAAKSSAEKFAMARTKIEGKLEEAR